VIFFILMILAGIGVLRMKRQDGRIAEHSPERVTHGLIVLEATGAAPRSTPNKVLRAAEIHKHIDFRLAEKWCLFATPGEYLMSPLTAWEAQRRRDQWIITSDILT
jgi:hypothetical protein